MLVRRTLVWVAAAAATAALASAQQIWVGNGSFGGGPPRWARAEDFDGGFVYCRGFYTSIYSEAGGMGWWTDYPGADNNFSVRLAELTRVTVTLDERRQPNHVVVRLDDPMLYRCPMLFMEDVGTLQFSEGEVQSLRRYFRKGGFLWVDDFWGNAAWAQWRSQMERVLPSGEFPLRDIPSSHPIMHALYDVPEVPQVPSINFWRSNGGATSERYDSQRVHVRGVEDARGRLMVLMTHNTDIADTWEREGEWPREYFDRFSPRGYAIGVNVVLYAMTH